MPTDLASAIEATLTPDVTYRAALLTGEDAAATRIALESSVPAALAGLIQLGLSGTGGGRAPGWMSGGVPAAPSLADDADELFAGGEATRSAIAAGQEVLAAAFGPRLRGVGDLLARASGVRRTSALVLLSLTTTLTVAALRRELAARDPETMPADVLREQGAAVARLAPAGLSEAMRVVSLASLGAPPAGAAPFPGPAQHSPLTWVVPILLAVVLVRVLVSYLRG